MNPPNHIHEGDPEWVAQARFCIVALYEILSTEQRSHAMSQDRVNELYEAMVTGGCWMQLDRSTEGTVIFSAEVKPPEEQS